VKPLVYRHLGRIGRHFPAPVLTLGVFDGVHLGHQAILRRVAEHADTIGGTPVALTFVPHPAAVLAPTSVPPMLTDWRDRAALLAAHAVPNVILQRFTRSFASIEAEDFVSRFLIDGLGVEAIIVGHRVRFGRGGRGDVALLEELGRQCNVHVEVIGPVSLDGVPVSSSAVREAVLAGDLATAEKLLNRPHAVSSRVVHGRHRGRTLGFPPANMATAGLALPANGVYAVRSCVGERRLTGVANIGTNPTFQESQRSLEVHLFDFEGDIYGRRMQVEFVRRLRGEVKFPNPQALIEQISRDVTAARDVLAS
jgi:riboflavin kinase / FMN adenylyltransferase